MELRVYYSGEEMVAGMTQFVNNPNDYIRWGRAEIPLPCGEIIMFMYQDESYGEDWVRGVPMTVMGLHLTRVWCDVRVPKEVIQYCMARLRHPEKPVDNHIKVFYKTIWEKAE